jgi:hypothetical protein
VGRGINPYPTLVGPFPLYEDFAFALFEDKSRDTNFTLYIIALWREKHL